MGIVFGKYKEPAFDVLLVRANVTTPYEVRRYGERFAVEANHGRGGASPFPLLAGYIGVMSRPKNEEGKSIAMTTPVAMHARRATSSAVEKMQFILPAEYNDLSKIPKPTDSNVRVTSIPPAVGAVHRYSGFLDRSRSKKVASNLAESLREDGLDIPQEEAFDRFEYWRYDPPMKPPFVSRNEVWIELTQEQVDELITKFTQQVEDTKI